MPSSEMLLTLQNNTECVVATNVFNVDGYDWGEGGRPATDLHQRVMSPRSEITEPSHTAASYHLGLTFSDGRYLELTVDPGATAVDGEVSTRAAEETCRVSGSLESCRVERVLTGLEPRTLHVGLFDRE